MGRKPRELINQRWSIRMPVRRGDTYHARIFDTREGRLHCRSTAESTLKKALQASRDLVVELEAVERAPEALPGVLFRDAVEQYIEERSHELRPASVASMRRTFKVIDRSFGDRMLGEIRSGDVETYIATRPLLRGNGHKKDKNPKPSPRTKNLDLVMLRTFARWSVRKGFLLADFTDGLKPKPEKKQRRNGRAFTEAEARSLVAAASAAAVITVKDAPRDGRERWSQTVKPSPELRLALLVGLMTGIRYRTQTLLEWKHIDWSKGTLRIPAANMKTDTKLEIPLHPSLLGELRSARGDSTSERVFTADWRQGFKSALGRAGLDPMEWRWHDARHTFGSWLGARVPMPAVCALMGHEPPEVWARYQHPTLDALREALGALPDLAAMPEPKPAAEAKPRKRVRA